MAASKREADGVTLDFRVTDGNTAVPVTYSGVVPDLFREGQGVVAEGKLAATARSAPRACWPSTTRNTCRPKWSTR